MSNKAIIIQSKDNKISGIVTEASTVNLSDSIDINNTIISGMKEIENIFAGIGIDDPTKKKCSRCKKLGRLPFHDLEDFSLLKNGKRHSQCKVCRVEQSMQWETEQGEIRREYHRNYAKNRNSPVRKTKGMSALIASMQGDTDEFAVNGKDALFVAFPNTDIANTE